MKLNSSYLRSSASLGLLHFITSAVVIFLLWEPITHRISKETWPILVGYGLMSLVLVATPSVRWSRRQRMLFAFAVPYLASTLAYFVVAFFWAINRAPSYSVADITGFFAVTLVFPYLAIWGPLISIGNALLVWLMNRKEAEHGQGQSLPT